VAENANMNQNNRTTCRKHLHLLFRAATQSASSGATLAVFCKGRDACAYVQVPPSNIQMLLSFKGRIPLIAPGGGRTGW